MGYVKKTPVKKAPMRKRAAPKRSVATKVATLTRTVKKLTKISYDKVTLLMNPVTANVTLPYYVYHVTGSMNSWFPIFGSNSVDITNADKAYINSYKMDVRLSQASEADRIYYSAFVVSLKDSANDSTTFDPASGNIILADNIHYQTLSTNGRVLLNQKFFNIHSYKRFTMGGRSGDQSTPETRDLSFTIVPKQKLLVNPRGNVFSNANHAFPRDPSQNYYILLFNDDSGVDLQVNTVAIGGLASVAVAA